ncbi:DUF4190 domain-containing protein [Microbacterium sp. NIBRBAC000506063]|uniref:DUF4190 domain-containing protein n=1 Tax=Microbacterium sp. NIBRBAC000506063 TaxID=2734618 RepID=UPI001BB5E710|nr:DUF4190 domain-containing protein [Microbacterium sp. NIBRBAC000506063]QTV79548.1 DUF4190 domain-containing protein [Microbacterium sp. NIBRBAC000506063]
MAAPVPGKTLGIVALVVAFFASLIGIILGFVAKSQSKKAGVRNTPATVAIVLGFVFLAIQIIVGIVLIVTFGSLVALCGDLGPGTHIVDGVAYTCG